MNMIARNKELNRGVAALALVGALQMGGVALAHERIQQGFTSSGNSTANGQVRFTLQHDTDGRLDIRVRGLAPDQSFDVLVGAVRVGTVHTTGGGNGALRFRSRPRGHDTLLGFDPRGALITIRDASGTDVLVTTVPTTPSSNDPTKVACCKPDDGGAECEDRTVDQCMSEGGAPAAAASCLPNPCDNTAPPVAEVICCEPDDSGSQCEDRSMADCAAHGGIVVEATSCTPNPCAAVPPADGTIQCCVADDSGSECEDRSASQCAAEGGSNMGPGTCTPNPCAAATTATPSTGDDGGADSGGRSGGSAPTTYYGVTIGSGGGEDGGHRGGGR